MFYRFYRLLLFLIFKIFFRFEVKGAENIPKAGGFILASNHVSYLDPIAVGIGCARTLNFMARDDLFRVPVLSTWMYSVGAFPVKRNSADLSAMKEAIHRVRRGEGLALFPEGTRSESGKISSSAEPGIGFLASKLNVPVIPAFIKGTEKAFPRGAKFIKLTKISVCYGKQISIERGLLYKDIAGFIIKNIRQLAF